VFWNAFVGSHDCEHVNVYVNDLIHEREVVTEKIHGTQFILLIEAAHEKRTKTPTTLLSR
jgi:hypothetical protein